MFYLRKGFRTLPTVAKIKLSKLSYVTRSFLHKPSVFLSTINIIWYSSPHAKGPNIVFMRNKKDDTMEKLKSSGRW